MVGQGPFDGLPVFIQEEATLGLQGAQVVLKELIVVIDADTDHPPVEGRWRARKAGKADDQLRHVRQTMDGEVGLAFFLEAAQAGAGVEGFVGHGVPFC
jgi:hypothetical protein